MKPYRAKNKRIIQRESGGRFRRTTLKDIGLDPSSLQDGFAICKGCGHGESVDKRWFPIVVTGVCPKCGSQEKNTELRLKQIEEMARAEWESLSKEGKSMLLKLQQLCAEAEIHPLSIKEIDILRLRLVREFNIKWLKGMVSGLKW